MGPALRQVQGVAFRLPASQSYAGQIAKLRQTSGIAVNKYRLFPQDNMRRLVARDAFRAFETQGVQIEPRELVLAIPHQHRHTGQVDLIDEPGLQILPGGIYSVFKCSAPMRLDYRGKPWPVIKKYKM